MMITCPVCGGNDADAPCAYPSEDKEGCLRERVVTSYEMILSQEGRPYLGIFNFDKKPFIERVHLPEGWPRADYLMDKFKNGSGPLEMDVLKRLEQEIGALARVISRRDFGPLRGCICPPTSEQTCHSPLCPRQGVKILPAPGG